jgi:integrase
MRGIISKQTIDRLAKGTTLWDQEVRGFFARRLPSNTISFGFRYWFRGKHPLLSLGTLGSVTPAEARRLAKSAAGKVAAGRDPQEEKTAHRARVENSVNKVIDTFMERHVQGLRSAHAIAAVFANHVRPALGAWSVYDVGLEDVNRLLDRVEDEAGAGAAQNVLQYVRQSFAFWQLRDPKFRSPIPAVRGLARIRKSERARTRTLDDQEIRDLWRGLADLGDDLLSRYAKALLLSTRRRGELAGMRWEEVTADGLWIVPPERSKSKSEIAQPVTRAFREMLGPPRSAGFVFSRSGTSGFTRFSARKAELDAALATLREREGRPAMPAWRWHDLRRTARTLMSRAGVTSDIAEMVLGHKLTGIRGVYDRHGYEVEKRAALDRLAALIQRIVDPPAPGVVVSLKG